MGKRRLGVWIVGARGGVATTVAVGIDRLRSGETSTTGLVTELPEFAQVSATAHPLVAWDEIILGGHDIRSGTLAESAQQLQAQNGALPPGSAEHAADFLAEVDQRIRPGVLFRSGPAVESLAASQADKLSASTGLEAIERVEADLTAFQQENNLDQVVVVLLASTEPPVEPERIPDTWPELEKRLPEGPDHCPLRMSSLYAIAAFRAGMAFVNFTPSLGAGCRAIEAYARQCGLPHCGADGKTGETLLKSTLAPMFAARNLEVMSWVGHNLLGNRDGQVLADEANKSVKVQSKAHLLGELLGYEPQSHVSIEPIDSLGDWKTAWDHVHFRGFLGVPMTLQLTWQGCDSALAAPLVIDLIRLIDHARRRGESGAIGALAAFFKSPLGASQQSHADAHRALVEWVN